MRHIVLLAPDEATATEDAGRVCRFVVGALLLSHGARRDVRLDLAFDGRHCISFDGSSMRNVRPDEQSLLGLLKAGLRRLHERGSCRIMQGISVFESSLEGLVEGERGAKLYYAGRGGRSEALGSGFCAVFQMPSLGVETRGSLERAGFQGLSLGKCQLFPDQAVVALNNKMDRLQAPR